MYNEKLNVFQMRESKVLKKIKNGGTALCTKLNLADARGAQIAALSGFDCIWVDMEHVPNDWSVIEKQIMAAKMYDVDTLVRVSKGSYPNYIKPLEMDASGIMVPHLMSLEEAKWVAKTTKFLPIGLRPVDGGNADADYCNIEFKEYIKQANEQRFTMIQIEDPEPLDELDEICQVEGIDMIFFGPADFAQAIGTPGDFTNPELVRVKKLVAKTARKHGKIAGTIGSVDNYDELVDMGYNFISIGADVVALGQYYKNIVDVIKNKD